MKQQRYTFTDSRVSAWLKQEREEFVRCFTAMCHGRRLIIYRNYQAEFGILLTSECEMTDEAKKLATQTIEQFFKENRLASKLHISYIKGLNNRTIIDIAPADDATQTVYASFKNDYLYDCTNSALKDLRLESGIFVETIKDIANDICKELQDVTSGTVFHPEYYTAPHHMLRR